MKYTNIKFSVLGWPLKKRFSIAVNMKNKRIEFEYSVGRQFITRTMFLPDSQFMRVNEILNNSFINSLMTDIFTEIELDRLDGDIWYVEFLDDMDKCVTNVRSFKPCFPPEEFRILFNYVKEILQVTEIVYYFQ